MVIKDPSEDGFIGPIMVMALASCLPQLETLEFRDCASPRVYNGPMTVPTVYLANLKKIVLPDSAIDSDDLQKLFDGCPSLLYADLRLNCGTIDIRHGKLEELAVKAVVCKRPALNLVAPSLTYLCAWGIGDIFVSQSSALEHLEVLQCCSSLSLSPLPNKLSLLYIDCDENPRLMRSVAQIVSASKATLLSLHISPPSAGQVIEMLDDCHCVTDGKGATALAHVWRLVQSSPVIERLRVDASRISDAHLDLSLLPNLAELEVLMWSGHDFFSTHDGVDASAGLHWLPLVKQLRRWCQRLKFVTLLCTDDGILVPCLSVFCEGYAQLPGVWVTIEPFQPNGVVEGPEQQEEDEW